MKISNKFDFSGVLFYFPVICWSCILNIFKILHINKHIVDFWLSNYNSHIRNENIISSPPHGLNFKRVLEEKFSFEYDLKIVMQITAWKKFLYVFKLKCWTYVYVAHNILKRITLVKNNIFLQYMDNNFVYLFVNRIK